MIDSKLITLITVAEQKSFTKAAEVLSLTQPAISHHISLLEGEYNTSLLIRGKNEITLTPQGEIVLRYAKRIQAIYDQLDADLKKPAKPSRHLKVGMTHTSENNIVAENLAKYGLLFKDFTITVFSDTITNLYTMLENFEIDLAVVEGPVYSKDFKTVTLAKDRLSCIMSPNNPLARYDVVPLKELKLQPLLLRLPKSATRNQFEISLSSINETIRNFSILLEIDNISTIKGLIRGGYGVSVLPVSSCHDELKNQSLVERPIEKLTMIRNTSAIYQPENDHAEIIGELLSAIRAHHGLKD